MSPKVLCPRSFFYLMGNATFLDGPCRRILGVALPPRLQQFPAKDPQILDGAFFGRIRRTNSSIGVLDHVQHSQYLCLQTRVTSGTPQKFFGLIEINASPRFHGQPPSNGPATTYRLPQRFFRHLRIYPSDRSFTRRGVHHF